MLCLLLQVVQVGMGPGAHEGAVGGQRVGVEPDAAVWYCGGGGGGVVGVCLPASLHYLEQAATFQRASRHVVYVMGFLIPSMRSAVQAWRAASRFTCAHYTHGMHETPCTSTG
jgi:hypothetical protein